MNALALAVVLAVAAAVTHAIAAVVQERLAARFAQRTPAPPSSRAVSSMALARIVRRRQWWIAVALAVGASLLHIAALRHGPLTVVQPLGALTLVLALPLRAAVVRRRVSRAEWRGAALTVVGLAGLLLLTAAGRPIRVLAAGQVVALTAVTAAVLLIVVIRTATTRGLMARSLGYATAAGIAFGVASALTQTVVVRFSGEGMPALPTPATAIVLVLAASGLLLAQAAHRAGLGAPLATLTLVNPAAAAVIGVVLLGESYAGGLLGAVLAGIAGLTVARGITLLARPEIGTGSWAPATLGVR